MGFNIAGLVINKNYQDDLASLENILNKKLVFEKEVDFEQGSENWKEGDYCDIYFTTDGTLVFLSMEQSAFEFLVPKQKTLSFVLSEMSMTFSINYTRNQYLIRSVVETEGEVVESKGDSLEFEDTESDKSELIYHLMEEVLGIRFWDIDYDEKCYRYNLESLSASEISNVEIDDKYTWEMNQIFDEVENKEDTKIDSNTEITKVPKSKKTFFAKVWKGLNKN